MKITNEMRRVALQAYLEEADEVCVEAINKALDAALADVPEPSIDAIEYRRLWGKCMNSRLAACNAASAAEAKLAKAREWAERKWADDLLDILDGDE